MSIFSLLLSLGALAGLAMVAMRAPKKLTIRYVDAGLGVLFSALVVSRLVYVFDQLGLLPACTPARYSRSGWAGCLRQGRCWGHSWACCSCGQCGPSFSARWQMGCCRCWAPCPSPPGWAVGAMAAPMARPRRPGMRCRESTSGGALAPRLPVQLLGALLDLALFAGLEQVQGWLRRPGLAASLGLLGWGLVLFGLSFLRADPAQIWLGLRLEAWGACGGRCGPGGSCGSVLRQEAADQRSGKRSMTNDSWDDDQMIDLTIDTPKVRRIITDFIREEISQAGYTRGVINLSGGIDSALACTLAAEALGPQNVLAIRLPYRSSSPDSLAHAQLVIDALGVQSHHAANHRRWSSRCSSASPR